MSKLGDGDLTLEGEFVVGGFETLTIAFDFPRFRPVPLDAVERLQAELAEVPESTQDYLARARASARFVDECALRARVVNPDGEDTVVPLEEVDELTKGYVGTELYVRFFAGVGRHSTSSEKTPESPSASAPESPSAPSSSSSDAPASPSTAPAASTSSRSAGPAGDPAT